MTKPVACVLAALALAGCERAPLPPAQQATRALEAAREDMEKARTSIEATEQQSQTLRDKIRAQRTELTALVERRLTLLAQQLAEDEERVRRLPAPKETELRPRLDELHKQLAGVKASLLAYRDAPPEKSKEALAALERSLASLAQQRREIEAQLQPA